MTRKQTASFVTRIDAVDALRGFAMVWMTVFHFCFDLNHFRYWPQDFYANPLWTWQRTFILSLFLFCAGMGQAIASTQGQSWSRFWRRWLLVMGCALLVSAGSWLMYPKSFIYFGVLHGMAAMLIIVRFTAHWGAWLWCLGALIIAIKFISVYAITMWASAGIIGIFNSPALNWLGLVTRNPVTEDYVPLLPWLGVMWWGVAAGTWLATRKTGLFLRPAAGVFKPLAVLGRWSLTYYMLHQPIMIGGLMALGWLIR